MKFLIIMLGLTIFLPTGDKFGKKQDAVPSREPFEIVDTLKLTDGIGKIILNKRFTSEKSNVEPTDINYIFPFAQQILYDTSDLIHSYGIFVSGNMDTIWVVSDSANDTSRIRIRILAR